MARAAELCASLGPTILAEQAAALIRLVRGQLDELCDLVVARVRDAVDEPVSLAGRRR